MRISNLSRTAAILWAAICLLAPLTRAAELELAKDARVVLLGNGLGSRMQRYGHFETELHRRYPEHHLVIRNLCDEGDTPAFRPNAGRKSPWAFPGGEKFRKLVESNDNWGGSSGDGRFPEPDAWLKQLKPDIIVAFFGFNESFEGPAGLPNFKAELEAFVTHTLQQKYNDRAAPRLALVSPTAFQDVSALYGTPKGTTQNANLALYAKAIEDVAAAHQLPFVNLFAPTSAWFAQSSKPLTRDGALLTDEGYARLAPVLIDQLFGARKPVSKASAAELKKAVDDFAWMWVSYYKIPNGVHVYGRRHGPFGPQNYPAELRKLEQMVNLREQAIWALVAGEKFDVPAADATTETLPVIGKVDPNIKYLSGEESLKTLAVPSGYKISSPIWRIRCSCPSITRGASGWRRCPSIRTTSRAIRCRTTSCSSSKTRMGTGRLTGRRSLPTSCICPWVSSFPTMGFMCRKGLRCSFCRTRMETTKRMCGRS